MSDVFFYKEFNNRDLDNSKTPLREKFNEIIKDLEENNRISQGDIKLIKGGGDIKYFRAKLSDSDRLLFTSVKHNDKDVFVILEVILNHDYQKSKFLTNKEKIKNIKIESKGISDTVEIKDTPQVHWLGKFITLSAKQEDIVENAKLPLIVSGSAGSGKTSVALEKFRKIEEKFEEGKVLYITQSENLIKQSKELYEYVYWDEIADEFKIGIPDRIEFLSLHKFLEKRVEDIKGKKPIDRSKFFSWFNEICKKGKFKEYKKDGDKIFEEFTAVIAGKVLLKGDSFGKDQYKKLGKRESIFPENERDSIYDFFKEYRNFIEEDPKYYDPNLIAQKCTEEKIYDAVVVDEVQDLTESTLDLILKSLKDGSKGNFLLCGDVNQVVHPSFFSLSKVKSFLCQNKYIRNQESESFYTLEKNYRNSEQVIELANRILHFKNYCFGPEDKLTEEEKKAFFMKSNTKNVGNVSLIAKNEEQKEIAEKVSGSANWAVLVLDDENKEDAHKLFNTPLVFNIHEAKGLEFGNVILYEFMFNKAYNSIWNTVCPVRDPKKIVDATEKVRRSYQAKNVKTSQPKDKRDKFLEEYKFYMNALYVGVTRAIDGVYVMDDEEKCNLLKAIKPKKIVSIDIKKEESSPEAWKNKALELIDKGNIEQAKSIEKKLQLEGEKKHAEEIMNALKEEAKDLDKASSELKTGNRAPQRSSTIVPNEKRKQSPSKKKKLTKKELEENTNRLFLALDNGNLQLAEQLIEQGVNVNAKGQKGLTSLHFAAQFNYYNVVKRLLSSGANVDARDEKDWTPLHFAAREYHKDTAKLLLQHKADVNAKAYDDTTPLHLAAEGGHYSIVRLLLEYGSEVNVKTQKGFTPLHLAANRSHKDIVELLLKHKKIDVNIKTQQGSTSLHTTTKEDIVELLLQHKADVNAKANDDTTPLHVMAKRGLNNVVQLLLDNGADVNAARNQDHTPLHLAAQNGHFNVAKLLLDNGASVDAKLSNGYTPLHEAAKNGYTKIVETLLDKGADVNSADAEVGGFLPGLFVLAKKSSKDVWTPLHLAASEGHFDVAKLLLGRGAKVNAGNQDHTPLHLAAQSGRKDIVKLLLNNGADINAKCEKGEKTFLTSFELAILRTCSNDYYSEIIHYLLTDSNINVGCIKPEFVLKKAKAEEDKTKFLKKLDQDCKLLDKVEKAVSEKDKSKLDEILKEIKELMKPENKYGFKPSLNYSPNGNDENTTIKIAIKAGGKLLQTLYDYAEKNIGTDTEIFKQLKQAKEKQEGPSSQLYSNTVSRSQTQGFQFDKI